MLVEEFAEKHDLCPEGHEMMEPFLQKTVREWWEDASQATRGTWVFWLASLAQLDAKTIVKCLCECARDIVPITSDPAKSGSIVDACLAWCEGRKSRDEVRALGEKAVEKAREARDNRGQFVAWSSINHVARCVDSTLNSPGACGALAHAWEFCGKGSIAEAEAKFAGILRKAFRWSDIEHAISEDRPSPQPRPKTAEAVQAATERRLAEYKQALSGAEAACANLESFCKQEQFTLDGVSRVLGDDGVGAAIRGLVDSAVQSMTAADSRTEAGARPSDKPKTPKRGRMMV
jgi:hypothetical protein